MPERHLPLPVTGFYFAMPVPVGFVAGAAGSWIVICDGSVTITCGFPWEAVMKPVTQMFFPMKVVSGGSLNLDGRMP